MCFKLLSLGILVASLASAQYSGGSGGGRGGGGGGKEIAGSSQSRMDQITLLLGLDHEQRKQVMAILDAGQKEAATVRDRMPPAQLAIAQAVQAGKSQDEIARAIDAFAALDTGMTSIELHSFAKVAQVLRDDQKVRMSGFYRMTRGFFNNKDWDDATGW